ncbi:hypothetical protein AAHX86_26205 (plasmid) [Klebsiella pneumoniae]
MEMTLTLSSGERDVLDQRIHQHEKNKPGLLANLFSLGRISKAWWDRYQRLTDESDALRATLTQQRQELQLAQSEKHNADNELRSLERELTQVIPTKHQMRNMSSVFLLISPVAFVRNYIATCNPIWIKASQLNSSHTHVPG